MGASPTLWRHVINLGPILRRSAGPALAPQRAATTARACGAAASAAPATHHAPWSPATDQAISVPPATTRTTPVVMPTAPSPPGDPRPTPPHRGEQEAPAGEDEHRAGGIDHRRAVVAADGERAGSFVGERDDEPARRDQGECTHEQAPHGIEDASRGRHGAWSSATRTRRPGGEPGVVPGTPRGASVAATPRAALSIAPTPALAGELPPATLNQPDGCLTAGHGYSGAGGLPRSCPRAEPSVPSACVNSLGMIQILFASPRAIWGSICRYW